MRYDGQKERVCIHQDDRASKRLEPGLSGVAPDCFLWHRRPDWRILSQTHIKVELPAGMSDTHQPPIVLFGKRLVELFYKFPTLPPSHSCWKRCICKICICTSLDPSNIFLSSWLLHYKRDSCKPEFLPLALCEAKNVS